MKKIKKPLTLDRESLRILAASELALAHGGGETQSCTHCSDQAAAKSKLVLCTTG